MANEGYINGHDMIYLEAEKYWSFPKSYKGDAKEEAKQMILSGDYIGAEKIDGAHYRFVKDDDGNTFLVARALSVAGTPTDKYEWLPQLHDFFEKVPNGSCLLGEVYKDSERGSRHVTTVMGCKKDKALERQEKKEKLMYYVFDVYAWDGEVYYDNTSAAERFAFLEKIAYTLEGSCKYVRFAKYYDGDRLLEELAKVKEQGGEGIVITRKDAMVEPGKRTARKTLKIKQEINEPIDAFITGRYKRPTKEYTGKELRTWQYWENDKTGEKLQGDYYREFKKEGILTPVTKGYFYGWAGAVEFGVMRDGKEYGIAWISGVTDEVKEAVAKGKMRHSVAKIRAMQIEPDTKRLRHAVVLEWREDKAWKDCDYEQLL